jgi:hypothetical protein
MLAELFHLHEPDTRSAVMAACQLDGDGQLPVLLPRVGGVLDDLAHRQLLLAGTSSLELC